MLQPKRTKFRKQQKGRNRGLAEARQQSQLRRVRSQSRRARTVDCATDRGGPTGNHPPRQARRQALDSGIPGQTGYPKPLEVRMGKGKGNVEYWVAQIKPGRVLYEMEGVPEEIAREALSLAAAKLPMATTFVKRTVM